jgi:hypothetical protein
VGLKHTFPVHFDIPEVYRESLEHDTIGATAADLIQRTAWEEVQRSREQAPKR